METDGRRKAAGREPEGREDWKRRDRAGQGALGISGSVKLKWQVIARRTIPNFYRLKAILHLSLIVFQQEKNSDPVLAITVKKL
jgi:hypothetical protein